MKLSRFQHDVSKIDIKAPIWGSWSIGIATYKIANHNEINILTKDKDGNRLYPQSMYISKLNAKKYPIEPVPSHPSVKLRIIPINDLEELEKI